MSRFFKHVFPFLLTIVLVANISIPAAAADTGVVDVAKTFAQWVVDTGTNAGEFFRTTIFGSSDPDTAYSDYVSSVQSALGTSTVGDNCVYLGNWSFDAATSNTSKMTGLTTTSGSPLTASYALSSKVSSSSITDTKLVFKSTFVTPVTGSYVFTPYSSYTGLASSAIKTEVDFSISPDPSNISPSWYTTKTSF